MTRPVPCRPRAGRCAQAAAYAQLLCTTSYTAARAGDRDKALTMMDEATRTVRDLSPVARAERLLNGSDLSGPDAVSVHDHGHTPRMRLVNEQRPSTAQADERNRKGRCHVVEVGGGRPGQWTFDVLDQDRWSSLTEEEKKAERHRAIKRRQNRRRAQRMRESGPRDVYTLAQIGDRDGWRCVICHSAVDRAFRPPHPCCPSVHHLVEIVAGGTDTLDNIALAHQFCNSDSYNWGQKVPAVARERLADRVLFGRHGPGRRDRVPDADAVALAAEIMGSASE